MRIDRGQSLAYSCDAPVIRSTSLNMCYRERAGGVRVGIGRGFSMIRACLALVIVLVFLPSHVLGAPEARTAASGAMGQAEATPAPDNGDGPETIPVDGGDPGGNHAPSRGDPPSRLLSREPGALTLWIILPGGAFVMGAANDTCVGAGEFTGLQAGGVVSLLDAGAGAVHIESVMIEAAGDIYFDTVLQEEVCAFDLAFTRVVPGTSVLVDLDRIVLGRFDHIAPADDSGGPPVYAIVAGA